MNKIFGLISLAFVFLLSCGGDGFYTKIEGGRRVENGDLWCSGRTPCYFTNTSKDKCLEVTFKINCEGLDFSYRQHCNERNCFIKLRPGESREWPERCFVKIVGEREIQGEACDYTEDFYY